ncbi:MAG: flippase [Gemmatimonadota bacterium]
MREIVRGASISFVVRVAGAAVALSFNIALARILGTDGTGLYFLALTVVTVAVAVGRLGLDNVLLRLTAASASQKEWSRLAGVYRTGIGTALVSSMTVAAVVFVAAPWISEVLFSKPALTRPLRWMSLAILPVVLTFLYSELLKGLKRILNSQLVRGIAIPGLSLVFLLLFGRRSGLLGAVWAYIAATCMAALVGLWLWRSATPQLREGRQDCRPGELLDSSLPLLWVALLSLVMGQTSTVLLGIWRTSSEVGIYSVATRTAILTSFIMVAVNSIAAPKFAELHNRGDTRALASTAQQSARMMLLLASPPFLLFVTFPSRVMSIFGSDFGSGGIVLAILAFGQFVNVATGSVGNLLMMSAHERATRNLIIAAATLNVALNVLLIPPFGLHGAAVATSISLVAHNIALTVFVRRLLGIRVFEWAVPRAFR